MQQSGGALKMPGLGTKTLNWRKGRKKKEKGERATWTPSVSAKVNISHIPPRHTGPEGSKVVMTNEWPGSPERPREEPLESLSRGTGGGHRDTFSGPGAPDKGIVQYKVSRPLRKTQPVALPLSLQHGPYYLFWKSRLRYQGPSLSGFTVAVYEYQKKMWISSECESPQNEKKESKRVSTATL